MKIQYPERGQPLDVDYLYQMAKSINSLHDKLGSSRTLSSIFSNNVQQSLGTSMIRLYSTQKVLPSGDMTAGKTEDITVTFDTAFSYPPVVTCTIQNNNTSSKAFNAIATIKNVGTTYVTITVRFNEAGKPDGVINVIAIGT